LVGFQVVVRRNKVDEKLDFLVFVTCGWLHTKQVFWEINDIRGFLIVVSHE